MRLVPVVVVLVALPGCGTSDDRSQARSVVERFYDAVRSDAGGAACDLLSEATAEALASQSGQSCERVITRLEYEGGAVVDTEVYATNAKVDLRGGESTFLNRERDGWRISAVACKPEKGKPRDRPFECEVEA